MNIETSRDINKLKVLKVKCLGSLLFLTRFLFKVRYNRKFVIGDHHKTICEALERVYKGECRRLIINIAPRYSKTELAVKNFIAGGLALNPAAKFIHLSYSNELALNSSEEVKDMVQEADYQQLFSQVQIKKDSRAKKKWYTTEGGGVYATSMRGQVTGFGAGKVDAEEDIKDTQDLEEFLSDIQQKEGFGGAVVIDDPQKPEDAHSDLLREKVNSRFDSTIRNRVNSRNTPIIIIMQRLHPNDLCGYLLENEPGEWEVLSLPAIKEDGTALWPHKHSLEELNKMWQYDPYNFECQYLQNPTPKEGLLYKNLRTYKTRPAGFWPIKAVVDTADTGQDYLCCIVYLKGSDGCYVLDVYYTQAGMETTEQETAVHLAKNKANKVKIESNNGGRGFCRNVEKICKDNLYYSAQFNWYHQKDNKEVRIFTKSSEVQNMIFFPEGWERLWPMFYKHVTNYLAAGKNKYDDGPDALTMIIEEEYKESSIWGISSEQ